MAHEFQSVNSIVNAHTDSILLHTGLKNLLCYEIHLFECPDFILNYKETFERNLWIWTWEYVSLWNVEKNSWI